MRKLILGLMAVALLATAGFGFGEAAFARGGMHHGGYHGGGGGYGPYNAMTPEQQAAAQKMHAEFYTATEGLSRQLASKEAELQAQMYSPNPDGKKIESLSREIGELQGKLLVERNKFSARMANDGIPVGMGCPGMGYGGGNGMGYGPGYGHGGGHGGWGHRGARCFW